MQSGDKVYYLHTDKNGTEVKYPAVVITNDGAKLLIRIGRLDPFAQKIVTFESSASLDKLLPRSAPCSFELDLNTNS